MKPTRILSAGSLIAVLGLIVSLLGIGPAQAAVGDLTCTATIRISFNPPLTPNHTTAKTHLDATLSSCASLNGNFSRLSSATVTAKGTATSQVSPCNLLLVINAKATFTWNTGETSTGDVTISTDPLHGIGTAIVTMTGGPLNGDVGTHVAEITPNVDCLTAGLRTLTSAAAVVSFN